MAAVLPLGSLRISAGVEAPRSLAAGRPGPERSRACGSAGVERASLTIYAGEGSRQVNGIRVAQVLDIVRKAVDRSWSAKEALKEMCADMADTRAFRNASAVAMNVLLAMPALAEEEKGKIFDFNLTLPIIAVQFLLLMVALDTIWFKPVAKVMDQRDAAIREKLLGVRDNSGEIKRLTEEAQAVIKAARVETTLALNKTKRETAAELEVKLSETRARIEKELAIALANLTEQKEETLKSLDKQVTSLSDEILQKVVPFKL